MADPTPIELEFGIGYSLSGAMDALWKEPYIDPNKICARCGEQQPDCKCQEYITGGVARWIIEKNILN